MKFLIAPDSFKECMTATEAALILKQATCDVFGEADTILLPVGDGGEGTLEVLAYATDGILYETTVTGPLGSQIAAKYAILGDGKTAVVEMAQASGLHLLPPSHRNPLLTTTIGTGELIREALSHPIEHLIVTIGGSATNDCGAGMLQALGASILDDTYQPVRPTGGNLSDVSFVDLSGLDPRLKKIKLSIACDVTNPLVGPNGASYVFGPQKGATPEMVQLLDQNIKHFADVIQAQTGIALHDVPGGGAAGGLGAALFLCGGAMIQGIDLVLDVLSFDDHLNEVDYVFTGEGRIDHQTSFGKVIAGIVRRASKQSVPVIAFAGSVRRGVEVLYEQGLLAAYSITPTPCTLEEALRQGKENLYRTAVNIMRLIRYTST